MKDRRFQDGSVRREGPSWLSWIPPALAFRWAAVFAVRIAVEIQVGQLVPGEVYRLCRWWSPFLNGKDRNDVLVALQDAGFVEIVGPEMFKVLNQEERPDGV